MNDLNSQEGRWAAGLSGIWAHGGTEWKPLQKAHAPRVQSCPRNSTSLRLPGCPANAKPSPRHQGKLFRWALFNR